MVCNLVRNIYVVCAAMSIAAQAPSNAAEPTVVAGKSMGRVQLGFTRAQVHKTLGKPSKTFKLKGGLTDDLWRAKKVGTDRNGSPIHHKLEVIYKAGKVIQVEATSPVFVTASGTSTRSAVSYLTSKHSNLRVLVYGYDDKDGGGWQNYYFVDAKKGISYEYEGWQENLYRRSMPSTIIIHKPGTRVVPDAGGKLVTDSLDLGVVMSEHDE